MSSNNADNDSTCMACEYYFEPCNYAFYHHTCYSNDWDDDDDVDEHDHIVAENGYDHFHESIARLNSACFYTASNGRLILDDKDDLRYVTDGDYIFYNTRDGHAYVYGIFDGRIYESYDGNIYECYDKLHYDYREDVDDYNDDDYDDYDY